MSGSSWTVYMVRCSDGSLYTGITRTLALRVEQHNAGTGAKYTRSRRPVHLVYSEVLDDKSAALRREIEIKRLPATAKRRLVTSTG